MESQWHFAFPALNYIPKLEKYKKDVPVKLWGAIKKQGQKYRTFLVQVVIAT